MESRNYPSIEQVCQIAARVFQEENKAWKVRQVSPISYEEVLKGMKLSGSIGYAAADCRAIVAHVISKHVPVYSEPEMRCVLLNDRQIGIWLGGITANNVWMLKQRACQLFSQVEYGCIYYAILHGILDQGFELWALPKDLNQPKRA